MKIKEGYKIKKMAGENVIITQGRYGMDMTKVITFNDTAEWLFNQLHGKEFTQTEVVRLLTGHFNVDVETANASANDFIKSLVTTELVISEH